MKQWAEDLEENLDFYDNFESHDEISNSLLKSLPMEIQDVYNRAASIIEKKNSGIKHSEKYNQRFLFPHLDWKNHPMIKALPDEGRVEFAQKLEKSNEEYQKAVKAVGQLPDFDINFTKNLSLANAKWAHDINLDQYLNQGHEILRRFPHIKEKRDLHFSQLMEELGLAKFENLESFPYFKEVFERAYKAGLTDERLLKKFSEALASLDNKEFENFIEVFGGMSFNIDEYKNFLERSSLLEIKNWLGLYINSSRKISLDYIRMSKENQNTILEILGRSDQSNIQRSPLTRWVKKKLHKSASQSVEEVLSIMKEMNLTLEEKQQFFGSSLFQELSPYYETREELTHIVKLFLGKKDKQSTEWALKELKIIKILDRDPILREFSEALLIKASDSLIPLGNSKFLTLIGGKHYLIKVKNKEYQILGEKEFNLNKIQKKIAGREKLVENSKIKVTKLELLKEIDNSPGSVYIVSNTQIGHQGVVVDNFVYSVISNKGIKKIPLTSWIAKNKSTSLVELNVSPDKKANLLNSLESQVDKPVKFSVKQKPGYINCTNMVSCQLEQNQVMSFPNSDTRDDSRDQFKYLLDMINKDPRIKRAIIEDPYAGSWKPLPGSHRALWIYPGIASIAGTGITYLMITIFGESKKVDEVQDEGKSGLNLSNGNDSASEDEQQRFDENLKLLTDQLLIFSE